MRICRSSRGWGCASGRRIIIGRLMMVVGVMRVESIKVILRVIN